MYKELFTHLVHIPLVLYSLYITYFKAIGAWCGYKNHITFSYVGNIIIVPILF